MKPSFCIAEVRKRGNNEIFRLAHAVGRMRQMRVRRNVGTKGLLEKLDVGRGVPSAQVIKLPAGCNGILNDMPME